MEVRTVAAGKCCSFFVDANGALLACGAEEEGQVVRLGLREGTSQTSFTAVVPTPVPSTAGIRIRAVSCHSNGNLAVSEAGHVLAWGLQVQPLLEQHVRWRKWHPPVPTVMAELRNHRVRQVGAGYLHCAALTEDGALLTWETKREVDDQPDEPVPELGYGRVIPECGVPCRAYTLEGVRIASVAVGAGFTVAVTEAGAVYTFGVGGGHLGHGGGVGIEHVSLPKRIEALNDVHVATVAAGYYHTLALTRCGRVYSWGLKRRNGMMFGLGNDSAGGDSNDKGDDDHSIPCLITALLGERVRTIAAGSGSSCAVTDTGALYTWGDNVNGNLGHGDVRHRNRPTLVQGLQGVRVVGVSIFATHTLVVAADGSVYAFGGGLGLGISRSRGGDFREVDEATYSPHIIPNLVCKVPRG
jgi:alpha-tubulin suppressor-like RCC1 family protein